MPELYLYIVVFVLGACVGSFLNVVIYRLPLEKSIVSPGSSCPSCGTSIKPWHNIPIVSWLALRGKCAYCGVKISARYVCVEALMGLLGVAAFHKFGPTLEFVAAFVFLAGLLAMTYIDIDHRIIPDSISLGGIVVGFAFSFFLPVGWVSSLIGLVAGGGVLLSVIVGYKLVTGKEGMGMGDVKLLAAIGAFLGWPSVPFTILMSSLVGSVVGILFLKIKKLGMNYEIPFGPFLGMGAVVYLFWGKAIIDWYLGMMVIQQ